MRVLIFLIVLINHPKPYPQFQEHIKTTEVDHSAWDALLRKHVDTNGNVDYKGFSKNQEKLDAYLTYLGQNTAKEQWSKKETLAYFINLYNAATVTLITENYPVHSIKDIKNPWDKEWITYGDKKISINHIEHNILRKMEEPRIHFAINCASFSCPKLLNKAYEPSVLEKQLQTATSQFINDPEKNNIMTSEVQLSTIFKWYKKDFTKNTSLIEYINRFSTTPIAATTKVKYLDYDWSLNDE